jgi:hypothetical protein
VLAFFVLAFFVMVNVVQADRDADDKRKTLLPCPSVTQKSSAMEKIRSRSS